MSPPPSRSTLREGSGIAEARRTAQVDVVVAMAMALERVEQKAPSVELVGWL